MVVLPEDWIKQSHSSLTGSACLQLSGGTLHSRTATCLPGASSLVLNPSVAWFRFENSSYTNGPLGSLISVCQIPLVYLPPG